MLMDREQKLVSWLLKRKVGTMRQLRHQFQISHMTVFRTLKKYGYHTSYNYNAAYYALHGVPQFDELGLWVYRDIRFSQYGTLLETLVALVEHAPTGFTVHELEELLQIPVGNLLSLLVRDGRLQRNALRGRQVVYLACEPQQAGRQYERRQQLRLPHSGGLPAGCSAGDVIEVLRQMIVEFDTGPDSWARQLQARGIEVTADQIRAIQEHYALKKKRRS
jgi:hypothetical protein